MANRTAHKRTSKTVNRATAAADAANGAQTPRHVRRKARAKKSARGRDSTRISGGVAASGPHRAARQRARQSQSVRHGVVRENSACRGKALQPDCKGETVTIYMCSIDILDARGLCHLRNMT